MPYYLYCSRCNEKGDYKNVREDCPKCLGTGHDWRDDHELEGYHRRYGITLAKLKERKHMMAEDDTEFIYKETIPPTKVERERAKQRASSRYASNLLGRIMSATHRDMQKAAGRAKK